VQSPGGPVRGIDVGALGRQQGPAAEQPDQAEDRVGRHAHGAAHRGEDLAADQIGGFGRGSGPPKRIQLDQELVQLGGGALERRGQALALILGFGQGHIEALEHLAPGRRERFERPESSNQWIGQSVEHAWMLRHGRMPAVPYIDGTAAQCLAMTIMCIY
jgi:hypothetical protein